MSILTSTNINPLPIVANLTDQLHRKQWGEKHPILTPINALLPFQIIVDHSITGYELELYDEYDTFIRTIDTSEAGFTGERLGEVGDYYYIIYNQVATLTQDFPNKLLYFKYTLPGNLETTVLYSELFQPVEDTTNIVSLEWWNNADLPIGDYTILAQDSTGFLAFKSLLNSNIGLPQYPFTKVVENHLGREFDISTIRDKTFTFGFWASETQYDALTICALADYIAINYYGRLYKVASIEFPDPEWNERGCIGWVDIVFRVDSVVLKGAIAKPTRGDFGDDYDTSFSIQ